MADNLSFIKTAVRTMTIEEMAAALRLTPKQVRCLIDRYHLDQYCELPKTDKVWELIGDDKVQCAVCGMWMQTINAPHLSKHNLTVAEYKQRFGLNKGQPLCCRKLSDHWRQIAIRRKFGKDEATSAGRKIFTKGDVRPHSYKKSKQTLEYRIKKGYQSKAGRAKKPREYLKHVDAAMIKRLRDENGLSFTAIAKVAAEKTGYRLSDTTIKRMYYGRRSGFSEHQSDKETR
ncbi:MAG: hypothetical protein IEMM0003_0888 [bacterium]|nr:MAG: hypothetical protein IEMM0003_0888 [bacterium]